MVLKIQQPNKAVQIEFTSIYESGTVNILVEDQNYFTQKELKNLLSFTLSKDQRTDLIKNIEQSQGSYNIKIQSTLGTYKLKIASAIPTQISLTLAKKQFNHLIAGKNKFIDHSAIFEVFSPGQSLLIQIFSCAESLKVKASTNYSLLKPNNDDDTGIIRMEHSNYGGHYVIKTPSRKGQFFVQIEQQKGSFDYHIIYHLLKTENGEKIPYHSYNPNSIQINHKYVLGGVHFFIDPVLKKDLTILQNYEVSYSFYISKKRQDIEKKTGCFSGNVFTLNNSALTDATGPLVFKIQTNKLKQVIGDSQSYFVNAEAVIQLMNKQPTQISQAYFVYELTQIIISSQLENRKDKITIDKIQSFGVWIVFPFLFGALLIFFAVRYLIRSFSAYPTQLVEEEYVDKSAQALASNVDKNQYPV